MKRYLMAALIIFPALQTGCVGEDWSLCEPEDNCVLYYRYPDEKGADTFAAHISTVDLMLFDSNGYFVKAYHSEKSDLEQFQGVVLSLEAGDYLFVAWGNLGRDVTPTLTTIGEGVLGMEDDQDGLPVFYAPSATPGATRSDGRIDGDMTAYRIHIPENGVVERDLNFTRAYRSINVSIKGYEDAKTGTDPRLQVEISHLAYAYDFLLRVQPERKNRRSITELQDTPEGAIRSTRVHTPYQEIEEEINITVTTMDGRQVCPPINLKQSLQAAGISLDPLQLHEINVFIEFRDGVATIGMTDWSDNEVGGIW